jgi:hypothetical protein
MQPFPDPKPNLLAPDADLQAAFDNAMAAAANPPRNAPIVLVALKDEPPHGFAGQRLAEVHYSASLLKMVAMYTAFELRKAANDLLLAAPPAPGDVFATLRAAFDNVIDQNRVSQLSGVNLTGFLLPRWEELFQVEAATSTVNFSPAFSGHLFDAIAKGDNTAAGKTVHSIGFGYLTKATASAGFFDPAAADKPATADGMWLCGDFGNGFPPQRIACVNDTPVAQATSVMQMARLFTGLAGPTVLVDGESDKFMLELLTAAVVRLNLFLNRDTTVQFVTTQSKIGLGPLNSGARVASEAAVIEENSTGRRFVAVFQNQPFVNDASITPVSGVVDATIASFLFP